MPSIVREKEIDNGIVTNLDGDVLLNCTQQDVVAVVRKYDDGEYDVIRKDTGELVLPKYNPETYDLLKCRHCGEHPWQ